MNDMPDVALQPTTTGTASASRTHLLYIISDGYPTHRPDITCLFGKYLPRFGVTSDLVAQATVPASPGEPPARWGGGTLHLQSRPEGRGVAHLLGFLHELRVLLRTRRGNVDAIQVRDRSVIALLALLRARSLGLPYFYWMSFPINESRISVARALGRSVGRLRQMAMTLRGRLGMFVLYRLVLPRATHVFVQSDQMRRDVAGHGIPWDRMTPVPMCVDPERFPEPDRSALPASGRTREVVYLGTCDRVRRIDFLFEVIARLKDRHPDVRLVIVGDAPEEADRVWLRGKLAEMNLEDRVEITGWLGEADAQARVAAAEVALALMAPDPLLLSTTPTKLVEYLALGLPVIANEHPDQRAVIEASGAGFCTPFAVEDYATALDTLLSDPPRARDMGRKGRDFVLRERSYPEMARRLATTYATLVAKTSGAERNR